MYRKFKLNSDLNRYLELKKQCRALIKNNKLSFAQQVKCSLRNLNNPSEFWSVINKYRQRKSFRNCPISLVDWEQFYHYVMPTEPQLGINYFGFVHPSLDQEVSLEELLNSITYCKNNKAVGLD